MSLSKVTPLYFIKLMYSMVIRPILLHKYSEIHLVVTYVTCFGHHQAILHKYKR